MPALKDASGVSYTSNEEKYRHLIETFWKTTSKTKNMTTVPFPKINSEREVFEMDMSLGETDVKRFINELRRKKAPGLDTVPGEALKLARDTLVPYLTILFGACIKLSYFPACFKTALVCIIPKPEKESYASAKSWRPIALLASVGKLFEKFLANRPKLVVLAHLLLPASQYGAPGKSTTECIKILMNIIHRNWSRKKKRLVLAQLQKLTKLGLDMASAFDRINRALILKVLADKGLPEYFIRMMQSFLSNRYIILKLPDSTSDLNGVNVGIPQGSLLSPLLFIFFMAPLLELLEAQKVDGVVIYVFSYVDDTYVVVSSQSYRKNCDALEQVHRTIAQWAKETETETEFSPQKYSIMHFKDPRDKSPDCQSLPDIPGVAGNLACFKEQKVKMLGVTLDPKLGFKAHVDDIQKRVNKKLRHLKFIARRKVGLTVQGAREFYMGSILPIFAYACEAWYLYSPKETLPQSLKEQVN
ncbi:zinc knuckle [Fusarium sporotrichioides]|uniref:Zinc knuckle n=1 Tax=Fusarium sporotrichioides TaxID=5514 RepID=A0A395RCD9_FUSSP|nr:zinc knuckle [Fusarium sporotrichioides]